MNFYVGQEVLCIKNHSGATTHGKVNATPFVKGQKYIISAIQKGCVHHPVIIQLEGVGGYTTCCLTCNGSKEFDSFFGSKYFVPIDNTLSETTVEELLNEPQPC